MEASPFVNPLAEHLRALDAEVIPAQERPDLAKMLDRDLRQRHDAANRRDAAAWKEVTSREEWERFLAPRLAALRASLGSFPDPPAELNSWVTGSVDGDGFRVENVIFESRPGVLVTANLYLPSPRRDRMPAFLIVHSHHNPKTQGELQEMGATWARQGSVVLVMDQLGHGERRQHRPGPRQDYRFRTITGIQLHVIGESLMGWMVWDIGRGIDLLLRQPGVDPERVILVGAVAGGGDPAAVAAALDPRVRCVIPFNFGGPQPESPYPLPDDAEESFDTMGGGSWESTRNLRLSGRDGFLPWVIVAVAPRCLVYAHEFSWDPERDPIWKRLQRVFALAGVPEHLAAAHGAGVLSGQPPEATHCNQVGAAHRRMLYPPLARWFGTPEPVEEYSPRLPEEALACMPAGAAAASEPIAPEPRRLHELWGEIGASRASSVRASLASLTPPLRRERLRRAWAGLLGETEPRADPTVTGYSGEDLPGARVERLRVTVEPGIDVPLLWLSPPSAPPVPGPVVIAVSQHGKERFLRDRAEAIAALLAGGISVCLPDVRGTGETAPEGSRLPQSAATSLSATEWMLGQTLLGSRLRDLRSVMRYLGTRPETDPARLALWGDSFASVNPPGFPDPLMGEGEPPAQSEPLGALLALFGALFAEDVAAVAARGTFPGYLSLLGDHYCYAPHDAIVPGALTAGDLCDVAAALAPRPLRLEGLVDGRNCRLSDAEAKRAFEPALRAYGEASGALVIRAKPVDNLAPWLLDALGC
jgi:cephalosporin-C deacetylase-like acetyl esterase